MSAAASVSTTTMVRRLEGMLDTKDLSEWEQGFVRSLVERLNAGKVTSLSEKQVTRLEELHGRHFG